MTKTLVGCFAYGISPHSYIEIIIRRYRYIVPYQPTSIMECHKKNKEKKNPDVKGNAHGKKNQIVLQDARGPPTGDECPSIF